MKIPSEILSQHVAVLGKTGSGKTSTGKLLIEQVVAEGARVCVLDPIKSDWWGLTSIADGTRAGLPFHILGGPRGHVPLHSSAGKPIAEIVATGALPLSIIDMADFEPGGQAKFFTDFAPTLLKKMRGVVYLVIEEAHLFAPKERSGIGAENLAIHWAKTLATAGRSKGVRLMLVTQRTQALHNALLGSCDTMIAHRLTAPADQEPVIKWLKANTSKEVLEQVTSSLASLRTGAAWLCSGEAKRFEVVQFPRIATYDNTVTPTGDGEAVAVKTAAVDQDKLRAIIGDAVEKAKADDPRELRKRIGELERQVKLGAKSQIPTPNSQPPTPKVVEKPVITDAQLARVERLVERVEAATTKAAEVLTGPIGDARQALQALVAAVKTVRQPTLPMRAERPPVATPPPQVVPTGTQNVPRTPLSAGSADVTGPQQRILNALAWGESMRLPTVRREKVAFLADASPKSSAFTNNLGALRSAGLIDYPQQGYVQLTEAGRAAAVVDEHAPTTSEELQAAICAKLTSPQARIVREAIKVYPGDVDRAVLAGRAEASASSSAYTNNLGALRSLGLLDYPSQGVVKAADLLFLEEA